jgi:hypothetical protein
VRRVAAAATYLYQDGPRTWYGTQPTVTKLAEDRADQLKRDPDKVAAELETRLRTDLRRSGDFARIHALPRSGADVPDDYEGRLVILSAENPYSKESGNTGEIAAKAKCLVEHLERSGFVVMKRPPITWTTPYPSRSGGLM